MSEPTWDEIRRYAVTGAGRHGVQGDPGTAPRSAHETPAAPELYAAFRQVVVAHRVPLDAVDALTSDLVAALFPPSAPFSPDLDLIGDLERGQKAAR